MDRKGSCATLLRLPLAQNNKRKIADVDENASDGYDQPGRLVIDTSQGRRNRGGGTGGPCPPPPNNLHKYAELLITKVCHFKKIYVCPPPNL